MEDFKPFRTVTDQSLTEKQTEEIIDLIQQGIAVFAGTSTFRKGTITGITVNNLTLTALAVGFSISGGTTSKTATIAGNFTTSGGHNLTLTTTGNTNVSLPTSGTLTTTTNTLAVFAATTSAQLAGVISDETGSGALVFANSPSLVTPSLGVASCTSINVGNGASGSFTTADAKTVTVTNGIITSIV